ncbi:Bug family tripartite tricarboxylate transporter substrate binding protein [Polaromonas sp. SM01]|uniref:Bug family tripartite tricarboxylate transporter substrate binding protein n=1 Tax=Polaromonas sp. SM01 TaxID=3085630 RepID=UPI00298104D5|nr:tripartite tricarboxylate transporter substrate-binding protein [Polaromonas sp. SM01]MDW5442358.1 tripartite tricarboxylate transporter substrate-binding protein [Polaromonas sp. SM01]
MNHFRRSLAMFAAATSFLSSVAFAQGAYPSRPIHFVVPFAAGGESDIVARQIATKLAALRGYTVIVDNYPGAGGNLGAEKALKEPADGYTLLVISGAYAANAAVTKPNSDPVAAIQPVIQFSSQPSVLVANLKYNSVAELLDQARKSPGNVNFGSAGIGSLGHLSNENFALVTGISLNHIPYKGTSGAVADLAGGQIDMMFAGVTGASALAKGSKIRMLAVTSPKRLPGLPDVPTLLESGVPFSSSLWHGLVASKNVPPAVIQKLNADLNVVLQDPEVESKFSAAMLTPVGGTPKQFRDVIVSELDRLKLIVKAAKVKPQ